MAEPSPSSSDSDPFIPYRKFSFDLRLSECVEVLHVAERFAPVATSEYFVQIEFNPTGRRWTFIEQNATAWIDRDGIAGPDSGVLRLPMFLLNTIVNMFDGYASVGVHVDHDESTVTVRDDEVEFTMTLPVQRPPRRCSDHVVDSQILIQPTHMSKLGLAMMTIPVTVPDADELTSPIPFLSFTFDGSNLSASMNWRNFNGPGFSASVPARGDHSGDFSAFAAVLIREMYSVRVDADDSVRFEFDRSLPNLMFVTTSEFSMQVDLGLEHVFWHRGALVEAIEATDEEAGLEVVKDERIGWDPTVRIVVGDALVDATITLGDEGTATHVRLSSLIVKDVPWTLEIAEEVNAWNVQLGNIKLVRNDADLFAVSDVPIGMVPSIGEFVHEVARKTVEVREVIGVFI